MVGRQDIINNQLGRRNLTAEQKKYLIGLRFNSEKKHSSRSRQSQHRP
jgi:hypothetical protein